MKYDVIIIGGGLGGLICARQLSKAGRSVLLLERQPQLGGCIQSYPRKGLHFDTGLHYVGGLDEGQMLHQLFSETGLLELPWQRMDSEGFDRVTIGRQTYCYAEGLEAFADRMGSYFPKEREALRKYTAMLEQAEQALFNPERAMEMMEVNTYDYLCSLFSDPLLPQVLAGSSLKMELRRESLPLYVFAHVNSSYIRSSWRLRGDGSLIVDKLVKDIRDMGGTILCNAEAEELAEREGRIVAVRCTNGETYEGQTFISDVHPALTFGWIKASQTLKPVFRQRIALLENTTGMFTASLVLKPGSEGYFNHNKYIYRKPNVWDAPFSESNSLEVDRVMISSYITEEGAPHQIDLLTPMPWKLCERWADTHVGHRGADYIEMKRQLAASCIRLAETVIPGLSTMVSECYTSTPLTWRDYTQTPHGSAYGIRKDCHNVMMTMLSPKTPIPNLLLTGQSVLLHGLEGVAMTAVRTCGSIDN